MASGEERDLDKEGGGGTRFFWRGCGELEVVRSLAVSDELLQEMSWGDSSGEYSEDSLKDSREPGGSSLGLGGVSGDPAKKGLFWELLTGDELSQEVLGSFVVRRVLAAESVSDFLRLTDCFKALKTALLFSSEIFWRFWSCSGASSLGSTGSELWY